MADIYIVNMFALDGKTEIRDYGAYSSVRNLTSEADISLDGDSVTVSAEAGTFYYQGNLKDAQLPLEYLCCLYAGWKKRRSR